MGFCRVLRANDTITIPTLVAGIAINTGTNLPSVATPNGQSTFLFLLTSALVSLIRLSYMKMVIKVFPYTVVLSAVGIAAILVIF